MSAILKIIQKSSAVARTNPWNDRVYVTLAGTDRSCAGDRSLKIWVKGNKMTVESGKGSRSETLMTAFYQLTDALTAAGARRDGYSDSITATFTLDTPDRLTIADVKGGAFDPNADGCE